MTQQTRLGKPVLSKSVEETNQQWKAEKGDVFSTATLGRGTKRCGDQTQLGHGVPK